METVADTAAVPARVGGLPGRDGAVGMGAGGGVGSGNSGKGWARLKEPRRIRSRAVIPVRFRLGRPKDA